MSALYFILIVIAAYYAFKFSMRLLLPFAMKKLAERMIKKAQQSQGGFTYTTGNPFGQQSNYGDSYQGYEQSNKSSDDKIRVDYVPPKEEKRKGTTHAGEFVDFEEVK